MLRPFIPLLSLSLLAQSPAPAPMPPTGPRAHGMTQQPAAEVPEPDSGATIAHLGARKVTYGEFSRWLKVMVGARAESLRKNPASRFQAQKQYLELVVLSAKGQQEKLQNTKAFQSTLAALKMQAFARVLLDEDRAGSDAQKIKEQAENPTDAEVKVYFEANKDRYATPERFTARHILVGLKGAAGLGDKGFSDEEAKARVAKVQEELKAGKKLEDLAKEYSDDPGSKNNGGLYKDIPYGRFAKEFEEAVRTQELGVVGGPVKTPFGYHFIQVESRSPRQEGDFETLKDSIRKQMVPERRERLTREFIEQSKEDVGFREGSAPAAAPAKPAAPKAQ